VLALAYTGGVGDALEELQSVVNLCRESRSPVTSVALRLLGTVMRIAGEPGEALRHHEESLAAIEERPRAERESVFAGVEIGLDRVELGRNAEAASGLEASIERLGTLQRRPTPLRADALLGLGRARLGLGRPGEALEALDEARDLWRGWGSDSRFADEAAIWRRRCLQALGR
jgi:tetratricopeptide (TPR) repeat protein